MVEPRGTSTRVPMDKILEKEYVKSGDLEFQSRTL
jgi:hypothetical protein